MWLDKYIPTQQDREISSFLSFHDAKRAAEAARRQQQMLTMQQQQAEAQAQAEAEAEQEAQAEAESAPVENPVETEPQQIQMMRQMMARRSMAEPEMGSPRSYAVENAPNESGMALDPDRALDAIFGNEGGKTGQRTRVVGAGGKRGSALGRYQIIDSTREGIRKGHFSKLSKDEFEKFYRTDPEFERAVARAHMSDLISRYGERALAAWYSPADAAAGRWNVVPGADHGNKLTVGQYYNNALNRYHKLQTGGWLDKYAVGGEVKPSPNLSPKLKTAAKKKVQKNTDSFEMRYKKVDSTFPDIVRGLLPIPDNAAQMVTKFVFNNAAMSENSLDDEQKLLLWDTIQNAKKRTGKNNSGTEYQDYGNLGYGSSEEFNQWFNKGKMGVVDVVKNSLTNPGYKLASTIGRGRYWTDPNDENTVYYTDVYDWNTSEKDFKEESMYQKLRNYMRSGEEKNLNQDKNDPNRMNFKLNRKEIETIRAKHKKPVDRTSPQNILYLPPDTVRSKQNGGWLDKYDTGGEVDPKPTKATPKGYARRTKEQREAWNALLDYTASKGYAGKSELDDRNQNLSRSIIEEFNKQNPKMTVNPGEIQYYQYELKSINEGTFPQLVTSRPEYADIWGQRMYGDKFNKTFIERQRSEADNWFGSLTSQQYYPQYEFVSDKKKVNYGVDYDRYAEAVYNESKKVIAKNKRGGKVKCKS